MLDLKHTHTHTLACVDDELFVNREFAHSRIPIASQLWRLIYGQHLAQSWSELIISRSLRAPLSGMATSIANNRIRP